MKFIVSILLLFAFFMQSTSQLWITGVFYANRDYIAKVLCINIDKPEMSCKGACQLKKQLEKDSEKQSPSNFEKNAKEVIVFFQNISYPVITQQEFSLTPQNHSAYFRVYLPKGHINSIFHPPSAMI